jgi:hypothetical protein
VVSGAAAVAVRVAAVLGEPADAARPEPIYQPWPRLLPVRDRRIRA